MSRNEFGIPNSGGKTPLFSACEAGNIDAIKYFLQKNANVNHIDREGNTPLFEAVKENKYPLETVEVLLKAKANIHVINYQRKTLLHIIAENNRSMIVKKLVEMNIDVNFVDKLGETALHIAAGQGHVATVKKLIRYGADINILNNNNQTALQIVARQILDVDTSLLFYSRIINSYEKIAQILKKHIIKLKCAGLYVNEQNIGLVYDDNKPDNDSDDNENYEDDTDDSDYGDTDAEDKTNYSYDYDPSYLEDGQNDYFNSNSRFKVNTDSFENKYEAEIEELKAKKIEKTNITYYDLLTKNNKTITKYVKVNNIMQQLKKNILHDEFPHYTNIIWNRVVEAAKRSILFGIVQKYSLPGIFHYLPHTCKDQVFGYLSFSDIRRFGDVMKTYRHCDVSSFFKEESH